jgi:muramoyltetrapeptide carboxypeptidase
LNGHLAFPPRLRPGDAISIVAPSGPVPREAFEKGLKILASRYRVVHDERIFDRDGFLAGNDEARFLELERALTDPATKAVVCARGGYGVSRIADRLDGDRLRRSPKAIVGFSDITALHGFAARSGVASIHGPVVTQLGMLGPEDVETLFAVLESPEGAATMDSMKALHPGVGEGWLFGGNLELLAHMVGTKLMPSLVGAVLLFEEVGERPYRIDRTLTQLRLSGVLDGVRGVVVGDLTRCAEPNGPSPDAESVVAERLAGLGVPVLVGAPIGHGSRNRAVQLGARVRLDAVRGVVEFQERHPTESRVTSV